MSHNLTKGQILRLVNSLSKFKSKKLCKLMEDIIGENNYDYTSKFLGFSGDSFEKGLKAIYQVKGKHKIRKYIVYVSWGKNGYEAREK